MKFTTLITLLLIAMLSAGCVYAGRHGTLLVGSDAKKVKASGKPTGEYEIEIEDLNQSKSVGHLKGGLQSWILGDTTKHGMDATLAGLQGQQGVTKYLSEQDTLRAANAATGVEVPEGVSRVFSPSLSR